MEKIKESKVMVELEEMRARHAKELEGLTDAECVARYKQEAEAAQRVLKWNLPVLARSRR
ncbi:MAG: hypothetical protein V1809_09865 [Planctomycetota bacterium]